MSGRLTRSQILGLGDEGIARYFLDLMGSTTFQNLGLTRWEMSFIKELPEIYRKYGAFTWKQRKVSRELIWTTVEAMERGQTLVAEAKLRAMGLLKS